MDRNRDQFWELLEPEHQLVRAFCRRLAGNRQDGDDLCQDALVAAFLRFTTLREPERFKAWLYRIVVNRYKNSWRGHFWRRFLPLQAHHNGDGTGPHPEFLHQAKRHLRWALEGLAAEDRALIVLFELEQWTIAELAELLGKSQGSVKVRLHRIRKRMRDALTLKLAKHERHRTAGTAGRKERLWIVTKPNVD